MDDPLLEQELDNITTAVQAERLAEASFKEPLAQRLKYFKDLLWVLFYNPYNN